MLPQTRKWILVAEDDEPVRKSICEILYSHFGEEIKIVQTSDGNEAISKLKNQTFHLIITDMKMPKKDGGEVVEAARSSSFNETTPCVIVSGYESLDVEKKYKFVNFVAKPLDAFKFAQMIRNLFDLGSTEKMISASIFNALLESSQSFLKEALKRDDFKSEPMQFKKRGQKVESEHAAIITVHVGKVSNTFSVLTSKDTLEMLRDRSEKISGTSLDVICKSLGYVILKHVLTTCGIIDSNQVKTKDITQDPSLLTNKQGILVNIAAPGIDYKIFATTKGGD